MAQQILVIRISPKLTVKSGKYKTTKSKNISTTLHYDTKAATDTYSPTSIFYETCQVNEWYKTLQRDHWQLRQTFAGGRFLKAGNRVTVGAVTQRHGLHLGQ